MELLRTLRNKNWIQVYRFEDDDPMEWIEAEPKNKRGYVTTDGEIYQFIRRPHSWYWRIWYDLTSYLEFTLRGWLRKAQRKNKGGAR